MENKFLLFIFLVLSPFIAKADANKQAISDGTTIAAIESALGKTLIGTNFQISSYAKAWTSYNPMSWVVDPNRKYRTINFSFTDSGGKTQKMSCSSNIVSGESSVVIHSCTGGDKPIDKYHQLSTYGYSGNSIIMDGVVSTSNGRTTAPTTGTR